MTVRKQSRNTIEKRVAALEKQIEKIEFSSRTPDWKYEILALELEQMKDKLRGLRSA